MNKKSFTLGMTAQQVQVALLSVNNKIDKSDLVQNLINPLSTQVPSALAVKNSLDVISGDFSSLGALSVLDSVNLSTTQVIGTLPISRGGTGASTAFAARQALNVLTPAEIDTKIAEAIPEIQEVDLSSSQVTGELPISRGGTGSSSQGQARLNLGVDSSLQVNEKIINNTCKILGGVFGGYFALGFEVINSDYFGIDSFNNVWKYVGDTLPFTVASGTDPSSSNDFRLIGNGFQKFKDSFALKIFQSPTESGLTEIQTRTLSGSEVYEVRKASDDSLATIYSDKDGDNEIAQDDTDNISDSAGVVEFYISDGDYYITVGTSVKYFKSAATLVKNMSYSFQTVSDFKSSKNKFEAGSIIYLADRSCYFIVSYGLYMSNDINLIPNSNTGAVLSIVNNGAVTIRNLGVNESLNPTQVSETLQLSIDTYNSIIHDVDFTPSFSQPLVLVNNMFIGSVSGKRRDFNWSGPQGVYAITHNNAQGLYSVAIENIRVSAGVGAWVFNCVDVRGSSFKNFQIWGGDKVMTLRNNWFLEFEECVFNGVAKTAGSVAVHFEYEVGNTYNLVNNVSFRNCIFQNSDKGLVLNMAGETVTFETCSFEFSNTHVSLEGQGGGKSTVFRGCYFETAQNGNIVFNKTAAGTYLGLTFDDNYFGTEGTAKAGIIEFKGVNGGQHEIIITNSKMRSFGGFPSENVLLHTDQPMSNIFLTWKNNGLSLDGLIPAFDSGSVDWRYLDTDVLYKCTYSTNTNAPEPELFEEGVTRGSIYVKKEGFNDAKIFGSFQSPNNNYLGVLVVTDAMPSTLRPAQGIVKGAGVVNSGFSSGVEFKTVTIDAGRVRTNNLGSDKVRFEFSYTLDVGRKDIFVVS